MSRIPRCPVCATLLSADRTVDERWVRRHPEPDLWVYRLACAQCLSIARVEVAEISANARSEASRAVVDVAGPVVARVMERLGTSAGRAELAAVVGEIAADAERKIVLRVPEVLARARSAYGEDVRLAHALCADWASIGIGEPVPPLGRLVLHPAPGDFDPRLPAVRVKSGVLQMMFPAETPLRVVGVDGGALLLEPPRGQGEIAEWLRGVDALVVWPDFVAPDGE